MAGKRLAIPLNSAIQIPARRTRTSETKPLTATKTDTTKALHTHSEAADSKSG
jgi:hypothetical protein